MEKELFDWDNFDQLGEYILQFYNCTLKTRIGNFEAGNKFDSITVDYENGKMELWNDKLEVTFKIKLEVGEQL